MRVEIYVEFGGGVGIDNVEVRMWLCREIDFKN